MRRTLCLAALMLVSVPASGMAPSAAKSPRPFVGRVAATWDHLLLAFTASGSTFEGGGPVTYMGKTTQAGDLLLNFDGSTIIPGYGSVTITAQDGDQLTFEYEGLLHVLSGEGYAIFQFTHGTGKFANATGGGFLSAYIDLSNGFEAPPMAVLLDGQITF